MRTNVNNYLKNRRVLSGMTQMQVAKALGYRNAQFISNVERNVCAVLPGVAIKICLVVGGDLDKLEKHWIRDCRDWFLKELEK